MCSVVMFVADLFGMIRFILLKIVLHWIMNKENGRLTNPSRAITTSKNFNLCINHTWMKFNYFNIYVLFVILYS